MITHIVIAVVFFVAGILVGRRNAGKVEKVFKVTKAVEQELKKD